jgi:hypothetical protein
MRTLKNIMEESQDEMDNNRLNHTIDYFLKTYKPKDEYEAYEFEVSLHNLVRAIYVEASKPYQKILSSAVQNMSFQSILNPRPNPKGET